MLMIKLVDARKGLHEKCVEPFHNEKVAESIYMYLCDGIEECDAVEPERKKGRWIGQDDGAYYPVECSECHKEPLLDTYGDYVFSNFCPNCGSYNGGEEE